MPIRVKCGSCKKTLSVKDHYAGKKIRCPSCQNVVAVPAATGQNGTSPSSPAAAAPKPLAVSKPAAEAKQSTPDPKKPAPDAKKPAPVAEKATPDAKKPPADPKKSASSNGQNGKQPSPAPRPDSEPPVPENVEEEALAVFAKELAPKEVDETPKTIDFTCQWCDEEVHLPVEMGGKQTQCPNPECRRIVKVPMPKVPEKKDWRTMDRRGPAAALVSQPEQLEDAWGTQEAVRARQDSLAQAGVIKAPPKPPIGAAGWIIRGFYACCGLILVTGAILGVGSLYSSSRQHKGIEQLKKLVEGDQPKITNRILAAATYSAIATLYLSSEEKNRAFEAKKYFNGALSLIPPEFPEKESGVNEQLFLIDLALSQIELGGNEDEIFRKVRLPWEEVRKELEATLLRIQAPEVRVMAMREVATRLLEKNQGNLALGLAGSLSRPDENGAIPPVASQHIALLYLQPGQEEELKKLAPTPDPAATDTPAHVRVGYAEGYARKGQYDMAFALTQGGPARDRLEVCLGVAAIAVRTQKNKEEAAKFVSEGLKIAKNSGQAISPWLLLHLAKLGAQTIDKAAHDTEWESLNQLIEKRLELPFKLRAELEVVLAKCDKASGRVSPDELASLEADDKEGITLALGWFALAQQHARAGAKKSQIEAVFADREVIPELIRPVVEVGSFLDR